MINRGWVPASKISPNSRASSQPKGEVTIEAVVRKSEKVRKLPLLFRNKAFLLFATITLPSHLLNLATAIRR